MVIPIAVDVGVVFCGHDMPEWGDGVVARVWLFPPCARRLAPGFF